MYTYHNETYDRPNSQPTNSRNKWRLTDNIKHDIDVDKNQKT